MWSRSPVGIYLLSDFYIVFSHFCLISAPGIDLPMGGKGRLERLSTGPLFCVQSPQLWIVCQPVVLDTTLLVLVHSSLGHSPRYPSDKPETLRVTCLGGIPPSSLTVPLHRQEPLRKMVGDLVWICHKTVGPRLYYSLSDCDRRPSIPFGCFSPKKSTSLRIL